MAAIRYVVTVFAMMIGLPLGLALGRWLAGVFADEVGTVGDVVLPVGALAIVVASAALLALVVAVVPGRLAERLQPATVLRSE